MIVLWRITERCNLSCPFCAYDKNISWPRREADVATIRRFGAVLADYQQATGDRVLVSWIGGEPLLFPGLAELTTFFTKELSLLVSATTNGTTLSSNAIRKHIMDHYAELTISVDAIGTVHDELRGWSGGYAKLRTAVRELAELKRRQQHGPLLRANVVLMRNTLSMFPDLCMELAEWGIEEITFNQLGGRDRPEFFPGQSLRITDAGWLAETVPALRLRLAQLGVALRGGADYLVRIRRSSSGKSIAVEDCRPGEDFLFINEQAIASPCHFTTRGYGIALEEVDSVAALRELPERLRFLQQDRRLAACRDCHSTRVFSKFAA